MAALEVLNLIEISLKVCTFRNTGESFIQTALLTFQHDVVAILRYIDHDKLIVATEAPSRLVIIGTGDVDGVSEHTIDLVISIVGKHRSHVGNNLEG